MDLSSICGKYSVACSEGGGELTIEPDGAYLRFCCRCPDGDIERLYCSGSGGTVPIGILLRADGARVLDKKMSRTQLGTLSGGIERCFLSSLEAPAVPPPVLPAAPEAQKCACVPSPATLRHDDESSADTTHHFPEGWTDAAQSGLCPSCGDCGALISEDGHTLAIPFDGEKPFPLPEYLRWGRPVTLAGRRYLSFGLDSGEILIR